MKWKLQIVSVSEIFLFFYGCLFALKMIQLTLRTLTSNEFRRKSVNKILKMNDFFKHVSLSHNSSFKFIIFFHNFNPNWKNWVIRKIMNHFQNRKSFTIFCVDCTFVVEISTTLQSIKWTWIDLEKSESKQRKSWVWVWASVKTCAEKNWRTKKNQRDLYNCLHYVQWPSKQSYYDKKIQKNER